MPTNALATIMQYFAPEGMVSRYMYKIFAGIFKASETTMGSSALPLKLDHIPKSGAATSWPRL